MKSLPDGHAIGRRARAWLVGLLFSASLGTSLCSGPALAAVGDGSGLEVADVRPTPFQSKAQREMQAALGAPIKTRQDAINAAYLSVGWTWGADTPDALDNAAYRKAWSWGFRIEDFARSRDERFYPQDLEASAIRPYALPSSRELPEPSLARAPEPTQQPSPAPHEARIQQVERQLALAQANIARIGEDIDSLEQRMRTSKDASEREGQQLELNALNRALEEAQGALTELQSELVHVSSKLASEE